MNISLRPELQRFVQELVSSGRFTSEMEVLEAGIARLMLDPEFDGEVDSEEGPDIEEAEREIANGDFIDWKELSARLRRRYL
jgi:Arc/MetJ-type ribon-helix-helix transcriptional regulator